MSKIKEEYCRLCLEILDNDYEVIDESIRGIFEALLLKVDLSVGEERVVCKSCMEDMQKAYDFKFTCIAVNIQVVSFAIEKKSAELDIRDVYLDKIENKNPAFSADHNICRFCLWYREKSNLKLLGDLRKISVNEMLLKCIPEVDPNIIKEPMICAACTKSLKRYYSFAIMCQNTEENIMEYCGVQGTECKGEVSLCNVLKFIDKAVPEYGNCSEIETKGEDNLFQNGGDTYSCINNTEFKIDEEELIIKDENDCEDYLMNEENSCGKTGQTDVVEYDLQTHDEFSDIAMFRCPLYPFESKHQAGLKAHMLVHKDNSNVTAYECDLCGYKEQRENQLPADRDPSEVVMHRCEKCTYETKYKDYLKKLMLIHKDKSEVGTYNCNLCSYKTIWKRALAFHMLIHNSSKVVMYKCDKCTYETKRKNCLKKHILVHKDKSEVSLYKCNLCSFETKRKASLGVHMLTHKDSSELEIYKCERCTFESKYKHNLKNHMYVHKDKSDVTMYRCATCPFETIRKRSLSAHMLVHKDNSELTMFGCELCDFKSEYKRSYNRHMLIHKNSG